MRAKRRSVFWIPLLLLAVVFALPDSWGGGFKAIVRDTLAPVQIGISDVWERWRDAVLSVRNLGDLKAERDRLAAQLSERDVRLQELEQAARENTELRKMLELKQRARIQLKAAEVVSRDPDGWWQTLRIDKGRADRIRPGMPVISINGLVGQVREVTERTAEVLLLTDPACKVSVYTTRKPVFGIVQGRGAGWGSGSDLRMEFINKGEEIQKGDAVLTSGLGGVYPRGLHVGYVERVYLDASGLYQRADIVSQAGIGNLSSVFVVEVAETTPSAREPGA